MIEEHSLISPSKIKRIIYCPGSLNQCKDVPDTFSLDAAAGTAVHFAAERCLKNGTNADEWLGVSVSVNKTETEKVDIKITQDFVDAAQIYLDYVRTVTGRSIFTEDEVEVKLDLGFISPGTKGTSDCAVQEFMGCADVFDYKNGVGVFVEAEANEQAMMYALGVIGKDNPNMIEDVRLHIIQPRYKFGPNISKWEISVDSLNKWRDEVLIPACSEALLPDAKCTPGDWCRSTFCPALRNNKCPALLKNIFKSAEIAIGDDSLPVVDTPKLLDTQKMSAEQLSKAMSVSKLITEWAKAVENEVFNRLKENSGDAPKDYKLVEGRAGNRKYKPGVNVFNQVKALIPRKDVYEPEKFVSPANLIKNLKKGGIDNKKIDEIMEGLLLEREPGKPQVAPITDKRKAVNLIEQMFGKGE